VFKVAMSHTTTSAISSTEIHMRESSSCIFLTVTGYSDTYGVEEKYMQGSGGGT